MEGALDSMINDQKAVPGDCKVTLIQFDTTSEVVFKDVSIQEVPPIKLIPRGGTALWDAISMGLANSEAVEADIKVVVIITDGEENSSRECDHDKVKARIADAEKNNWKFVFLGAGLDAMKETSNLGIRNQNAVSYGASPEHVRAAVRGFSGVLCKTRDLSSRGIVGQSLAYTQSDFEAALAEEKNPSSEKDSVSSITTTDTSTVSTSIGSMTVSKRRR